MRFICLRRLAYKMANKIRRKDSVLIGNKLSSVVLLLPKVHYGSTAEGVPSFKDKVKKYFHFNKQVVVLQV